MDELDEMIIKIYAMRGMKIRNIDWEKNECELWDEEILPPNVNAHPGWWTMCSAPQNYPRDIAAAWELEESIVDYDDRTMYTKHLIAVLEKDKDIEHEAPWSFRMLHATAEQRCRAWLAWKEAVQQEAQ